MLSFKKNTTVNTIITEQAKEDVLPQGGDVESTYIGNEYVDGALEKGSEYVLALPPEDVARHQAGQLADEFPVKAEDNVKDCGVGPSGTSDGNSYSEDEAPDFVIPPGTNVVEINDDQTTPVALQRGRPRQHANVEKSPFVHGSGLSELGETPLKPVKGRSPLMSSITSPVDYKFI
ncbi:hypothetical protein K7X08_020216 [Anisodus acutangulus]|uniref:Uncharacterized protein n=1 Tax=Anisodus acutangulus TaxID=402998 RepID=A0A9Q1M636_9SOLA|nr:hypothetical protein K7X08_020216 [Anisodus acutangulus]